MHSGYLGQCAWEVPVSTETWRKQSNEGEKRQFLGETRRSQMHLQ